MKEKERKGRKKEEQIKKKKKKRCLMKPISDSHTQKAADFSLW